MSKPGLNALFTSFPVLTTGRLKLRQVSSGDEESLLGVFSDPRVMEFYDIEPFEDRGQVRDLIARWHEFFVKHDGIRWGITLKPQYQVIGTIGLRVQTEWRARLGYELARAYWRRGIMAEALGAVIGCAFRTAELERLEAHVIPGNEASSALLVKLGFEREGLLRHFGFFKDAYQDLQCYSLLSADVPREGDSQAPTI